MAATSSVTVALRIKPAAAEEKAEKGCLEVTESADGQKALVTVKGKAGVLSEFAFDTVFMDSRNSCQSNSLSSAVLPNTQRDVFERVAKPLCRAVLQGMHASILAYGQTGSGKTYTMLGPLDSERQRNTDHQGLLPRCLSYLFEHLCQPAASAGEEQPQEKLKRSEQQEGRENEGLSEGDGDEDETEVISWKMEVQFVEIYQERIFDLLGSPPSSQSSFQQQTLGGAAPGGNGNNNSTSAGLAVRYDKHGKGAHVAGAVRKEVFCLEDALEAFRAGLRVRRTSETKLNTSSSRSHAIFSVFLTQTRTEPAVGDGIKSIVTAQLHLVDLAGSERQKDTQAVGERLREAGKINSSLCILSQVVRELAEGGGSGGHVPYRDSKLTFLLMNSLGGSGKAAVIATLNQQQQHAMETRSTLGFAALSKSVRLRPVANQMLTLSNERVLALVRERAQMVAELKRLQALVGAKEDLSNEEITQPSPTTPACSADLFQALIDATEAAESAKTRLRAVLRCEEGQYSRQADSQETTVADKSAHQGLDSSNQQHHLLQLLLRHSMYSPQLLLQLQEAGNEKDPEGGVSTFLRAQAALVRLLELQRQPDSPPHGALAAALSSGNSTVTSAAAAQAIAAALEKAVPLLKGSILTSSEQHRSWQEAAATAMNSEEQHRKEDMRSSHDVSSGSSGDLMTDAPTGGVVEEKVIQTDHSGLFRSLWEPQMLAAAELLGNLADAALFDDIARDKEESGAREGQSGLICSLAVDEALQRLAGLRGFTTLAKEPNIERACSEIQETDASVDRSSADTDSRSSTLASRGISSTDAAEETTFFPLSPRSAVAAESSVPLNSSSTPPQVSDEHSAASGACTAQPQAEGLELLEAEEDMSGSASEIRGDLDHEQLRRLLEKERCRSRALEKRIAELERERQNYPKACQLNGGMLSQEDGEDQRTIGLPFVLPLSAICDGQNIYRGQLTFCVHPHPGQHLTQRDPSYTGPCYISIWEDAGETGNEKTLLIDSIPFTLLKKVSRVRESSKAKESCGGFLAEHTARPVEGQPAEGSQLDEQHACKASTFSASMHFLYRLYFRQPVAISLKGQAAPASDKPSCISWVTVAIQGDMISRWNICSTEDCDKLILQAMRRGAGKQHTDGGSVRRCAGSRTSPN